MPRVPLPRLAACLRRQATVSTYTVRSEPRFTMSAKRGRTTSACLMSENAQPVAYLNCQCWDYNPGAVLELTVTGGGFLPPTKVKHLTEEKQDKFLTVKSNQSKSNICLISNDKAHY